MEEGMHIAKGRMVCQKCGKMVRDRVYMTQGIYPLCMTCYFNLLNTEITEKAPKTPYKGGVEETKQVKDEG